MINEIKETLISLGASNVSGSSIKEILKSGLGSITGDTITGNTLNEVFDSFNNQHACKVVFDVVPDGVAIVVKSGSNVIAAYSAGVYYLKEGAYTYTATLVGYVTKADQALSIITAEIGTTKAVEVELVEDTCEVTFATTPVGATVVVKEGEEVVAATSGKVYDLEIGDYTYSVTADGYDTITDAALSIVLADIADTKTVTVELEESTCVVTFAPIDSVSSEPITGATIVVKLGETTILAEVDGTYKLVADTYAYDISADLYTSQTAVELIISAGDVSTGTKTIATQLVLAG